MSAVDPRMNEIVAADASREVISDQFNFIEGPIWHPKEQHLTFSDIPENKLYRYQDGGDISVYRDPSNMANGNTYDQLGRIISCLHGTSQVVRDDGNSVVTIASHFEGKELNSPNDVVVAKDGSIYFTDPTYGRMGQHGIERELQLDFRGVYRISPNGDLALLASDFNQPNGLTLDLNESRLYVADTSNRHVRVFQLDQGTLSGGEIFCESPAPDGLKIDSLGNLYAGGPGGVHVYHHEGGTHLGVIETQALCANFAWGGSDYQTLFMTASTTLFKIRVLVPGLPLF